jgi:hypothetical protein
MDPRQFDRLRGLLGLTLLGALVAVVAIPVMAADPSPATSSDPVPSASVESSIPAGVDVSPAATSAPEATPASPSAVPAPLQPTAGPSDEPQPETRTSDDVKPGKGAKGPEADVQVTGAVATSTDPEGRQLFSLTAGGTTYELSAGPPWFWGDDHPLLPFVGRSVTVAGTTHEGSTEIDVATVNGVAVRAPGKPPWAGGWKRVGEKHPGWSQEKWDRWQARQQAKAAANGVECWPPGHCKKTPSASGELENPPGD